MHLDRKTGVAIDLSEESAYAVRWAGPGDAVVLFGADWYRERAKVYANLEAELSKWSQAYIVDLGL